MKDKRTNKDILSKTLNHALYINTHMYIMYLLPCVSYAYNVHTYM